MPIQVASFLIPRNGNTWYILEDKYLKGGLRICQDSTERAAIHPASLKAGMLVLLITDNKLYQLGSDMQTWTEFITSAPAYNPFYTHLQSVPSKSWIVKHNRVCRYFSFNVYDDNGVSIFPDDVTIIDDNSVQVDFIVPITGQCTFAFDQIPVA